MGHMAVHLMVGTGWIEMTQSKMEDSWKQLIDTAMDIEFTLVLV